MNTVVPTCRRLSAGEGLTEQGWGAIPRKALSHTSPTLQPSLAIWAHYQALAVGNKVIRGAQYTLIMVSACPRQGSNWRQNLRALATGE